MTEIIGINDSARLVVKQDDSPECPRGDWAMTTGYVNIPGRGDSRHSDVPAVHPDHLRIAEKHEAIGIGWYEGQTYRRGNSSADQIIVRWAKIFHGLHVEYDSEHGGYWFCRLDGDTGMTINFPDLVLGSPEHLAKQAEIIEQERETYRQWADGEVYVVTLQRAETWCRLLSDGTADRLDTREEWENVDDGTLHGCYLDDEYTAEQVAMENFDLTDDELLILAAR